MAIRASLSIRKAAKLHAISISTVQRIKAAADADAYYALGAELRQIASPVPVVTGA